ncbi:MAG: hypothetical protein ACJ798_09440 [Phenylobacterium sp.]
MLRVVALRAALVALPFVAWFLWGAWARRTGRAMGSTPWPWLFAAGAVLVALSLIGTVVFHRDNRNDRYVPGEATPGGAVTAGHFEKR